MLDLTTTNTLAGPAPVFVPYDPLSQQHSEPDTTFLLDPDGDAAAGFPIGQPGSIGLGGLIYANDANAPNIVAGRFRKGIQAATTTNSYIWMPVDGVVPTSEFTIEFWMKVTDTDWSAISNFNWNIASGITFNVNVARASFTLAHGHNPAAV